MNAEVGIYDLNRIYNALENCCRKQCINVAANGTLLKEMSESSLYEPAQANFS